MIRQTQPDHQLVVTQNDHALLAAQLAERLGNARCDGPDPRPAFLSAVELHDSGWPLHDDEPTINRAGAPLNVLEISAEMACKVWRESARLAAERDPYAGLLVSLHVFNLSASVFRVEMSTAERFEKQRDLFLLNQFQQDEIERQETLRQQVGLRIDRPLHLGLADAGIDREEDRLRFNFHWLRIVDLMSLYACSGKPLFDYTPTVYPRIGDTSIEMYLEMVSPDKIKVSPWPFAVSKIELEVSARRMPKTPFSTTEIFRKVYAQTPIERHRLTFVS